MKESETTVHRQLRTLSLVFSFAATAVAPAGAADTAASAASGVPDKPAFNVRVGGSPADAAFREAQQKSGAEYRAVRTACRNGPAGGERSSCLKAARDKLKAQRLEAQAAHDAAKATR